MYPDSGYKLMHVQSVCTVYQAPFHAWGQSYFIGYFVYKITQTSIAFETSPNCLYTLCVLKLTQETSW